MNETEPRSDEELLEAASRGEEPAAAALIHRHAALLYDFAVRVTLDDALAAASVEAAWRRAWDGAAERPGLQVRSWLLSLTREEALEALRLRGGTDAAAANSDQVSPGEERFVRPADSSIDPEEALWAWQAARSQRPRDYCFIDLDRRRGLAPQEIGDIGSLSRTGVYGVLGRLRGVFEESYLASVLSNRGRDDCPELDAIFGAGGAGLTPALRREVNKHAETCETCSDTHARVPAAADVFAGLQNVAPAPELEQRLLIDAASATSALALAGPTQLGLEDAVPPVAPAEAEVTEAAEASAEDTEAAVEAPLEAASTAEVALAEAEAAGTSDSAGWEEEEPDLALAPVAGGPDLTAEALEADAIVTTPPDDTWGGAVEEPDSFLPPPPDRFDDFDEPESEPFPALPRAEEPAPPAADEPMHAAGAVATGAAIPAAGEAGRIQFAGDLVHGMPPPRRPWDKVIGWIKADDLRSTVAFAVLGAVTLGFAYLGFVIGSSIEGGGGDAGEIPAQPTRAAGVREVSCGDTPTTLDQGSRATLTFDPKSLPDYRVTGVAVRANSPEASSQNVVAQAQDGLAVLFEAKPAPGTSSRTDTYQLTVTFAKGDQRTIAECTVLVKAPAVAPTPTPQPASPTPAATATRTPAPVAPTTPPVIQPTTPPQPTATRTPALCTPTPRPAPTGTPPTPFPFPTFTPLPVPCP